MSDQRYEGILRHPRHQSATRHPMSLWDRAAQFAPFSALAGHAEGAVETARTTEGRAELSEDGIAMLDWRIQILKAKLEELPEVSVTYFVPDQLKSGGAYMTLVGRVKKIDAHRRLIMMNNGDTILIEEIVALEGEIFEEI